MYQVGYFVSGRGRLFQSAVQNLKKFEIFPAFLLMDEKADQSLEQFCSVREIPVYRFDGRNRNQFDHFVLEVCLEHNPDLIMLTFDKIIHPELLARFPRRVLNVHMALLPAFKGLNALSRALKTGVRFVGATIHEAVEQVDAGAIVAQAQVAVRPGEDTDSVGQRLFPLLELMYNQVIVWYAQKRVECDAAGRIWIRDASYGELSISPTPEISIRSILNDILPP
ncbi:hypothetical protein D6779_00430 [Candidatus Parcubacteria bacterium]|nr:MAG: hypothetical protein D6779_00430 [Candidatus Parcubacteria bacterium]